MQRRRHLVVALILGLALVAGGCASTGAIPRPFPTPSEAPPYAVPVAAPSVPPPPAGSQDGYAVAGTALSFRGVPYRIGGGDPSGFDCSGLVYYVFSQHGIKVPRTVAMQFHIGTSVDSDEGMQPGDLVFFNTTGSGPSHVGIMIGSDAFVHAPSSSGDVRVERLGSSYWSGRFLGARRVN